MDTPSPAVGLRLGASATLREARELLAQLPAAPTRIDASALQTLDSSAVALLLEAGRRASAAGGRLVVEGAPPKLRALATLYGVDSLLSFEDGGAAPSAGRSEPT